MSYCSKIRQSIGAALLISPMILSAAVPVKSMVVFGDSLSDTGNTTSLLKSLRNDENPSYLVLPLKIFVVNKMIEFADDYYVPQMVLDAGIAAVTTFFDEELAPMLAKLIGKIRLVPILPGEPYWQAHFSNGRVWNEYLAPMLDVDREDKQYFNNYAYGGSWAVTYDNQLTVWNLIRHPLLTLKSLVVGKLIPPSLGLTVQGYLLMHRSLDENTVYFVLSGGNDYLNVLRFEDNYNPAVMSDYIDNVIDGLFGAVLKLTQAGARHVVIIGLPSIGETPKNVNTMDRRILNEVTDLHNQRLASKVDELQEASPEVDFMYINAQPYLQKVLKKPQDYGFSNVKDACIDVKFSMFSSLAKSPFAGNFVLEYMQVLQYHDESFAPNEKNYHVCNSPEKYLFWDEIHPSTRAHRFLANDICEAMKEHGYETSCKEPPKA